MPDKVSSECGNADGFTYCPHTVSFRLADNNALTFPNAGFPGVTWNSVTSELTIDPALAQTFSFNAKVSITGSSP